MKKIIFLILIFFTTVLNVQAEEVKRITVGNKNAKITIIAFESLTCSHCANFHKNVYPLLKENFIDSGLANLEFRSYRWTFLLLLVYYPLVFFSKKLNHHQKHHTFDFLNLHTRI